MKKVLLIDDDPITNFINKKLIEKTGLATEIIVAQSGKQGLQVLIDGINSGNSLPDLIILDINMPLLNGFEFLQHLYAYNEEVFTTLRIAILSSSDHVEDKTKAKEFGIHDFITKPITPDTLVRLLQ